MMNLMIYIYIAQSILMVGMCIYNYYNFASFSVTHDCITKINYFNLTQTNILTKRTYTQQLIIIILLLCTVRENTKIINSLLTGDIAITYTLCLYYHKIHVLH